MIFFNLLKYKDLNWKYFQLKSIINYLSAMQNTAIYDHICYKCPLAEMTAYCKSQMIMLIVESMVFFLFFWFSSSTPSFIFIEAFCLSLTLPKHKEGHVHCTSTLYATIHFQLSKGSAKTVLLFHLTTSETTLLLLFDT